MRKKGGGWSLEFSDCDSLLLGENHWARADQAFGDPAAAAGRRLQRSLRPPQRPSPRLAHIRVAARFDFLGSAAFFLSCPSYFLPLNTTARLCWLRLLPMSPSIPPLFSPLLPRRRLCHCPSCIDAPASITILIAAPVCVVPFVLLSMPPRPPIAFHDGTLRLPLLIPPIPPPSPPPLQPIHCRRLPLKHLIAILMTTAADVTIDPTTLSLASGLVASCCCCLRLCCHLATTILF